MKNLQQKIKDKLSDLNGKYILIHSDITSGFNIKYQGNTHLFLKIIINQFWTFVEKLTFGCLHLIMISVKQVYIV